MPNFRNAIIRAKIAQVQGDFHVFANAIEMYHSDTNSYLFYINNAWFGFDGRVLPSTNVSFSQSIIRFLTTPVSYLPSSFSFSDPFGKDIVFDEGFAFGFIYTYGTDIFADSSSLQRGGWAISSLGPDAMTGGFSKTKGGRRYKDSSDLYKYPISRIYRYQSSNGLISNGDIHKFQGGAPSPYCTTIDGKPGSKALVKN